MYSLSQAALRPYPVLFLVIGVGLAILWRRKQDRRAPLVCVCLAFLVLVALSTGFVNQFLLGTLEWRYAPLTERPADADAIVVLAAGIVFPFGDRAHPEMDDDSRLRCLYAGRLYHQGKPCPVFLSGGKVDPEAPGPSHAALMGEYLLQLGVRPADLVLEERSRTTYENAVECRQLLAEHGVRRPLLVTDAVDMLRAECCFSKQGMPCVPAPSRYRAPQIEFPLISFLPCAGAARSAERVGHEWLGMAWYWICGRI